MATYFPPAYFSPAYFSSLFNRDSSSSPDPVGPDLDPIETALARLIRALETTRAFARVVLGRPSDFPSHGAGASPIAYLSLLGWKDDDEDPEYRLREIDIELNIRDSHADSELRNLRLNQLAVRVKREFASVDLGPLSVPSLTKLVVGKFDDKSRHPDQLTRLRGTFALLIPTVDS